MASSLFFFSSPPRQPSSESWPHSHSTSTSNFFTPQHHPSRQYQYRVNAFAPPSPSPLRSSRNVNLMSSPPRFGGNIFDKAYEGGVRDENSFTSFAENGGGNDDGVEMVSGVQTTQQEENVDGAAAAVMSMTTPGNNATSATTTNTTTTPSFNFFTNNDLTPSPFSTTTEPSSFLSTPNHLNTSTNTTSNLFQYASRARSSSPSTLLQTHTKDNRDSRKRLFLDRLRSKRDDARSERAGDQVLRMDFLRERRRWEEEKRKSMGMDMEFDDGVEDEFWGVDADRGVDGDGEGLSPTEEREIEVLADMFLMREREKERELGIQSGRGGGEERDAGFGGMDVRDTGLEDFSDDGYDEAFMEVLSQDSSGLDHTRMSSVFDGVGDQSQMPFQSTGDSEMDMS